MLLFCVTCAPVLCITCAALTKTATAATIVENSYANRT